MKCFKCQKRIQIYFYGGKKRAFDLDDTLHKCGGVVPAPSIFFSSIEQSVKNAD